MPKITREQQVHAGRDRGVVLDASSTYNKAKSYLVVN